MIRLFRAIDSWLEEPFPKALCKMFIVFLFFSVLGVLVFEIVSAHPPKFISLRQKKEPPVVGVFTVNNAAIIEDPLPIEQYIRLYTRVQNGDDYWRYRHRRFLELTYNGGKLERRRLGLIEDWKWGNCEEINKIYLDYCDTQERLRRLEWERTK